MFFKTKSNEGSWTTYFRSFAKDVWLTFAAGLTAVLIIFGSFCLISKRTHSQEDQAERTNEMDFPGLCFVLLGILCQQGKNMRQGACLTIFNCTHLKLK